jgi:hypothetical protein
MTDPVVFSHFHSHFCGTPWGTILPFWGTISGLGVHCGVQILGMKTEAFHGIFEEKESHLLRPISHLRHWERSIRFIPALIRSGC